MHVPGERAFLPSKSYREFERRNAMRLLYIVTKGMNDPTLASVPLHIAANGSLEIGQEVSVVLAGDGTDLVIGDNAERMEGVGVPPMRELIDKLKDHEVPVYV
jgi:predicted peroxiredoxin